MISLLKLRWYGKYGEQLQQFEYSWDWLSFNSSLVKCYLRLYHIITFDYSYISKAGNALPIWGIGAGYAVKVKLGQEISGIGVMDWICIPVAFKSGSAPFSLYIVSSGLDVDRLAFICIMCAQRISF